MESHHLVILSLVQFRFGHPNQLISCISFIFSSVINCSFPVISPCKHCFQFRYSGGLACVSLSPAVVSDCLCLHSRSLTIRLWSAAHHRECHYDCACSQKKKGHGRTPGRLPGCTYRLSRFNEGTFQNVLWLLKSNDLAECKKFVIFFCIFIIFSFTFVNPFTYSVLGELKADMILKNYEKVLFLYL